MAENDVQSNSGTESDIPNPKKGTAAKKGPHEVETQFESLNRVKKLPVVEAAIHLSQDVYGRVKHRNFIFYWMFSRAEGAVQYAVTASATLINPVMQKMIDPITFVDHTLAKGIDKLTVDAPLIEEKPDEIIRQVKGAISDRISRKVKDIKACSYNKVHIVFDTKLGHVALSNVQRILKMTDKVLDKLFPLTDEEESCEAIRNSTKSDPIDRTMNEITCISHRIGNIAQGQLKSLKEISSSILDSIHYTMSFFDLGITLF